MAGNPTWTVRALSVPGPDTETALFVSFDDARFLFGAGEAMQRSLVQKRLSLRRLQAIFMSSGSHDRGGLAGALMTLADAGIKRVSIVGPPDIGHHIATLRSSVMRDSQTVDLKAYPRESTAASEVVYQSTRITVHAVALRPSVPLDEGTAYPRRPTQLSATDVDKWSVAIVNDMFRGPESDQTLKEQFMSRFNGLWRPGSADDRQPLPLASDADVATDLVYIVRTPDVRGKFDVAKAKELGIPNGPMRGKLTRGEDIEVDDPSVEGGKRVVRPDQCLVGGGPGGTLIVVTCSEANLPRLLSSTAFNEYRGSGEGEPKVQVNCMVHTVPRAVWEDPKYQAWVASFGPKMENLYADEKGTGEVYFRSSAWNALQLNMLDPEIFHVPTHLPGNPAPTMPPNAKRMIPNHLVQMYPPKPVEVLTDHFKDVVFPVSEAGLAEARVALRKEHPEYAASVDAAQAAIAADAERRGTRPSHPGDDIVVTTLGTGSAIPSIYRNVSCTHLDIPGTGGVIFDTGEGSLGQLRRRFGTGLKQVYADLKLIFISHMHADHHLGLAGILKDRFANGITSKLYLVAPNPIAVQLSETAFWQAGVSRDALENVIWISTQRLKRGWTPDTTPEIEMDEADERNISAEVMASDVACDKRKWPFVSPFRFHAVTNMRAAETINSLLSDLGLSEIRTPNVAHRGAAWGMVLTGKEGWKVVYSGDTKPCNSLIEAGQGASVLIHEATLEDDKPGDAEAKGHSTVSGAIDVGKAMNARYVILNHFSQRYPKIPKLPAPEPGDKEEGPTVAISFDFMSLRVADAWKMSHFTEPLSLLYAEAEEEVIEGEEVEVLEKPKEEAGKKKAGREKGKSQGGNQNQSRKERREAKQKEWTEKNGAAKRPSPEDGVGGPAAKKAREHRANGTAHGAATSS